MIVLHSDTAGRVRTTVGRPPLRRPEFPWTARRRAIRRQLERGIHLAVFDLGLEVGAFTAAFDAGMYDVAIAVGER